MVEDISMPLEVMLHTMRRHWREGRVEAAVALAKAAAPYLHARAGAGRSPLTLALMDDGQIDELCGCGPERTESATGNPE